MKKILIIIFLLIIMISFSNIIWRFTPKNYEIIEYSDSIKLSWNLNIPVEYYKLFFGDESTNMKIIYMGEKNTYIITDLISNKNYYWKIIAYTKSGVVESEINRFFLQLNKPKVENIYPNFDHDISSEEIQFSWSIYYPIDYTTEFLLYKNNEKIYDKKLNYNKLRLSLKPGINYKWYLIIRDKLKNKYIYGPYTFSTKTYEIYITKDNVLYKLRTYGDYIEKKRIFESDSKIESYIKYNNFLILKTNEGIEFVHINGNKTSFIKIKNIKDIHIEKKDNKLELYLTNIEGLYVYDITNPYYPFLDKEIKGKYISVAVNNCCITVLEDKKLTLMDKDYNIYFQENIENPQKIIYNNDNILILLTSNKLIKYHYKNGIIFFEKEIELSKIKDYDIYDDKMAFLSYNNEIYIYNTNLNLLDYKYLNSGTDKEEVENIKIYENLLYYFKSDKIENIELYR